MKDLLACIWSVMWKSLLSMLYIAAIFAVLGGLLCLAALALFWLFTHFSWIAGVVAVWLGICTFVGLLKWVDAE